MEAFTVLRAKAVVLPSANIDTDQIIPARFLKVTDKIGLGKAAFTDWRYDRNGAPNADFVLNHDEAQGAKVLIAGDNFGCGSSREHAPWALMDFGFRAVVSTSFADIFQNNALKNGLLPVKVSSEFHQKLVRRGFQQVTISLEGQYIEDEGGERAEFWIDPFARYCLLHGMDQLDFLLGREAELETYEGKKR